MVQHQCNISGCFGGSAGASCCPSARAASSASDIAPSISASTGRSDALTSTETDGFSPAVSLTKRAASVSPFAALMLCANRIASAPVISSIPSAFNARRRSSISGIGSLLTSAERIACAASRINLRLRLVTPAFAPPIFPASDAAVLSSPHLPQQERFGYFCFISAICLLASSLLSA